MWPYLEQFAYDAAVELREELGERPDFFIGNYSDGNLVATLMAQHMQAGARSVHRRARTRCSRWFEPHQEALLRLVWPDCCLGCLLGAGLQAWQALQGGQLAPAPGVPSSAAESLRPCRSRSAPLPTRLRRPSTQMPTCTGKPLLHLPRPGRAAVLHKSRLLHRLWPLCLRQRMRLPVDPTAAEPAAAAGATGRRATTLRPSSRPTCWR